MLLLGPRQDIAVDNKGLEQACAHLGIKLKYAHDKVVPVAATLDDVGKRLALSGENVIRYQLVDEVHDLINVLYGIFVQIVDELVERSALCWGRRCGNESLVDDICEIAPPDAFATGIVPKRDIFNKRRKVYCVYSTKVSRFVSSSTKGVVMANIKTEKILIERRFTCILAVSMACSMLLPRNRSTISSIR